MMITMTAVAGMMLMIKKNARRCAGHNTYLVAAALRQADVVQQL